MSGLKTCPVCSWLQIWSPRENGLNHLHVDKQGRSFWCHFYTAVKEEVLDDHLSPSTKKKKGSVTLLKFCPVPTHQLGLLIMPPLPWREKAIVSSESREASQPQLLLLMLNHRAVQHTRRKVLSIPFHMHKLTHDLVIQPPDYRVDNFLLRHSGTVSNSDSHCHTHIQVELGDMN